MIFLCSILYGCGISSAPKDSRSGESSHKGITESLRASEVLVSDKASAALSAENVKNPYETLDIPTQVTKIGDLWFIVDCYHDQIIYNDNLKDPLNEWLVMTGDLNKGHTLASDGLVYLTDDTENERILVFEKEGDVFLLTQKFENVTSRPHYIIYDERSGVFYAWCSTSGEMYLFRHEENDPRMYLAEIRSIPELKGIYVRSFTILGDEIYFVSGGGRIIKVDLETFKILEEYPVPGSMAGMVQLTWIDGYWYITISTDENWDQSFATMIRCRSLEDLSENDYEDVYENFIGGGTPYYITEAEGSYYLTEHRVPGHSVWRFNVIGDKIEAEAVY